MTDHNLQIRLFLYGSKGQQIELSTDLFQSTVDIRTTGAGRDGLVTCISTSHFADILTALSNGVDHIEGVPEFCQCPRCSTVRGDRLARRIIEIQEERKKSEMERPDSSNGKR